MSEQAGESIEIQLAILADDVNPATPATLDTIDEIMKKALLEDGYQLTPSYTGTRGGIWYELYQNRDAIALLVATITNVATTTKIVQDFFESRGQHRPTITLEVTFDEHTKVTIEGKDLDEALQKRDEVLQKRQELQQRLLPHVKQSKKATLAVRAQQPTRKRGH